MRNREISMVNVALCLLVMWIHICSVAITGLQKDSGAYFAVYLPWRLSAFVVQGFLFLSALKFFRNMEQKPFAYGRFLWGRWKKIGIPYLIAVVISYLGLIHLGYYVWDTPFLLRSILLGNMIAPFYFVIIIFQFYLLMPIWRWMVRHVDIWVAAVVSVLLMRLFHEGLPAMIALVSPDTSFAYNDRVFTSYLAYWVLGCYAGTYYEEFLQSLQRNKGVLLAGFLLFLVADGLLSYANSSGFIQVSFLEDIHTLYVCSAIVAWMLLAQQVAQRVMQWRVLQGIDRLSFYLYLYHGILLYYIQDAVLTPLGIGDLGIGLLVRAAGCYGAAMLAGWASWFWQKRKEQAA